jgi:hypothetical protein
MKRIIIKIYLKINLGILNLRIYFVSNDLEFLEMSQMEFETKKKKLDYLMSEASKTIFLLDMI